MGYVQFSGKHNIFWIMDGLHLNSGECMLILMNMNYIPKYMNAYIHRHWYSR